MKEVLLAGAGGQGVLTSGEIIQNVAIDHHFQATWAPEYGSAMRGGDANCTVKFGKDYIYNPMREEPDVLLAMNQSSFDKFQSLVAKGGAILVNADLVKLPEDMRTDVTVVQVPCMKMAQEIQNPRGANIIMTAVLLKLVGFSEEEGLKGMNDMFRKNGKEAFEAANTKAFQEGCRFS